MLELN
jgi:hypothetical protein